MPFNGSGIFSVINTFIPNTTILSSAVNQNLTDIASGLSDCLTRDNQAGMTAIFRAVSGSASTPGITFTSDVTTGLYLPGSHQLGVATNGTAAAIFDTDQTLKLLATGSMVLPSGTTAQQPGSPAAGMFRYNSDTANPEFYNTAWNPLLVSLAGSQLPYGTVINGTIVESNAANAATFAVKTLAGSDPSVNDPVEICFRNPTVATGNYIFRKITSATSLVLSSGSTLGASNGVAFKVWLVLFDDAGTVRLGAINTVSGSNIYPLGQIPIASSTAEGGAGGADSAQVFYTGTAVTSKAYVPFAYASYESGLATAGTWNVDPTRLQLYGTGVPLPGQTIHTNSATNSTQDTTGSGAYAVLSHHEIAITPTSAANLIRVDMSGNYSNTTAGGVSFLQISHGTSAGTNMIGSTNIFDSVNNSAQANFIVKASELAAGTSSITYTLQGKVTGGTLATPTGGANYLQVDEIMT